jgi:hypothetical protein
LDEELPIILRTISWGKLYDEPRLASQDHLTLTDELVWRQHSRPRLHRRLTLRSPSGTLGMGLATQVTMRVVVTIPLTITSSSSNKGKVNILRGERCFNFKIPFRCDPIFSPSIIPFKKLFPKSLRKSFLTLIGPSFSLAIYMT